MEHLACVRIADETKAMVVLPNRSKRRSKAGSIPAGAIRSASNEARLDRNAAP